MSAKTIPVIRRFSLTGQTINTYGFMTDDITGLTEFTLPRGANIMDIVGDVPTLPAYPGVEVELYKDGMPTGRTFFSQSMNPTSAGRMAVGLIPISAGKVGFRMKPTLATSLRFNILVKFDR